MELEFGMKLKPHRFIAEDARTWFKVSLKSKREIQGAGKLPVTNLNTTHFVEILLDRWECESKCP
jgi:hypothetical protein